MTGSSLSTIATATPFPASAEGQRIVIHGVRCRRLYVTLICGCTLYLRRPSLVDWVLGRIFGWWR